MKKMTINKLNSLISEDELIDLSAEEQKGIIGGECTYAGQTYSTGAQLSNGQVCQSNGTWGVAR